MAELRRELAEDITVEHRHFLRESFKADVVFVVDGEDSSDSEGEDIDNTLDLFRFDRSFLDCR